MTEPPWPTTEPEETVASCNVIAADGSQSMLTRALAFRHARLLGDAALHRIETARLIYLLTGRRHAAETTERRHPSEGVGVAPGADMEHLDNKAQFITLWDGINGKRPGCSWADNPWVWRIEFRRVEEELR